MDNPSSLLIVQNLQQSKSFYLDILGLTLVSETDNCLKLLAGNHAVLMFQGTLPALEYQHGYNANSTLVFSVDNLDDKIVELKSHAVEFIHQSPNQNDWGRYAAFKDPSGIVHELFELFR
ncbi:VOC family protein [Shewanella abyssi]|uniref:VOC family protein n=1 Tax=Shewanella abyssi TaxID=311789 RepID=UPI00200D0611|nr:VOC family protein [Shewanella abyssi]MCL1051508.1 VOC family protein [Shewanella abyssi]